MEYKDITTPNELMKYMDENITYGIHTDNKDYEDANDKEASSKWKLATDDLLTEYKYGHCFDQTELERNWFLKNGYEVKTFFIWFFYPNESNNIPTHSYLVYSNNNKYYYFEHADYKNRGIYEFDSLEEAIEFQKNKYIEYVKTLMNVDDKMLKHLEIREFTKPDSQYNFDDYFNHICNSDVIWKWSDNRCNML